LTSAVVAAAWVRSARVRALTDVDLAALAGLALLAGIAIVATWGAWGDLNNDTGYDFVIGDRFAHGELPYVDSVYYYGPLPPAVLGLAARIGGAGIAPFIALGLVVACAIVLATFVLARSAAGTLGGFLAAALVVPVAFGVNQFSYVLPHSSGATLGILTVLGVLLALNRYARSNNDRWLATAGFAAGLSMLTKPEFALAALAACALWLALRRRARDVALVAGPALVVPALVYGAFLTSVSAHRLLFENLNPRDFLSAAGNTMLHARAPFTVSSFLSLGLKLALYGVGVLLLVALARSLRARPRVTAVGIAIAVVLATAASVANPEALRHGLLYAWGWIPAGAAVALLLALQQRRPAEASRQAELSALASLVVLAATTYAAFYATSSAPQMAIYALPLAAPFLARVHLVELARSRETRALGAVWLAALAAAGTGLALKDAHAESATVRGPGGALRETPANAAAYQGALDWIERTTKPGEPILLAPQMTWMYAISGRDNPLPEVSLLPGALAGAGRERRALVRLQRAGVRVAVVDRRTYPQYGQTSFGASFDRSLDAWLREHFRRVATFAAGADPQAVHLEVWLRTR
jgi:hypothetical protein